MKTGKSKLTLFIAYGLWGIIFLLSLIFPYQLDYGVLVKLLHSLAFIQLMIAMIWFALLLIKRKVRQQAQLERVFIFILMSVLLLFLSYLPAQIITHALILFLIPLNILFYLNFLKEVYLQ